MTALWLDSCGSIRVFVFIGLLTFESSPPSWHEGSGTPDGMREDYLSY